MFIFLKRINLMSKKIGKNLLLFKEISLTFANAFFFSLSEPLLLEIGATLG